MAKRKKKWSEMTNVQRVGVVVTGAIQIGLAIAAWTDLAKREPERVNGPKGRWAGIIGINFVGPILYFALGRHDD